MNTPAFHLAAKTAVITGGASGIGLAIARRFAAHGAAIEILDLQPTGLETAVRELCNGGYRANGESCDVADPASVDAAFARLLARHERVHILVNNAGIAHVGNALNTTPEDFARIQRVNVNGVAHCTQAALRHMTTQGGGVILNLASTVSQMAITDRFAYATSKGRGARHDLLDRQGFPRAWHPLQCHHARPHPHPFRGWLYRQELSGPRGRDVRETLQGPTHRPHGHAR